MLSTGLVMSTISSEEIDEEQIEKLKEGDILESTFTEFAEQSPELYEALIAERDRFMAARLRQENADNAGKRIMVVVGAGHLEGLAKYLETDQQDPKPEIEMLSQLPPPNRWLKFVPWVIAALVFTGFYIGFSRSPELGWQLVTLWVFINGGLAALGALLARAHPVTILSAMVAAPLTSLNPAVAAGMVTGLVESWLRKPKISDLERLRDDTTTLKGWFKNPATRILLVFFFSNLGSGIGTWVAGFQIFDALS
jgi:pheromone shutdown-related protein TraB